MNINHLKAAALIIGLALFISCNDFTAPEFVSMQKVKFESIKDDQLNFSLNSTIKNPNPISLWVDAIDVDVYFDQEHLGNASSHDKIELEANKTSEITLHYSVPVDKLKSNMMALLLKKEVILKVDGRYTFKNDIKDITIPYTYSTPFNFKKEVSGFLLGNR